MQYVESLSFSFLPVDHVTLDITTLVRATIDNRVILLSMMQQGNIFSIINPGPDGIATRFHQLKYLDPLHQVDE